MIFVNSMGDLFHRDVPTDFIQDVFSVMKRAPQHIFQVLTKRARRMATLAPSLLWPANVWAGVTVESAEYAWRLDCLRAIPSSLRFVSFEPLLGPLATSRSIRFDWVIVGGESGPGARPMRAEWVRPIRDCCLDRGIPFFFKQWGGARRTEAGHRHDGEVWQQYPNRACPRPAISASQSRRPLAWAGGAPAV